MVALSEVAAQRRRARAVVSGIAIVYEDDDLLVAVKPHGMVVHPAHRHPDGTFWNALAALFAQRGTQDGPRLLHRLDRDTSGLICVPKRLAAHRILERHLRAGRFQKEYLALAHGTIASGTIDAPLARDATDRRLVRVTPGGQPARTHVRLLRSLPGFSLLRVTLETGRTHQIRAHLAAHGHPVAGDPLYGPAMPAGTRLFLHADRLAFPHPNGSGILRCRSPLPNDLRLTLCTLGRRQSCPMIEELP